MTTMRFGTIVAVAAMTVATIAIAATEAEVGIRKQLLLLQQQ